MNESSQRKCVKAQERILDRIHELVEKLGFEIEVICPTVKLAQGLDALSLARIVSCRWDVLGVQVFDKKLEGARFNFTKIDALIRLGLPFKDPLENIASGAKQVRMDGNSLALSPNVQGSGFVSHLAGIKIRAGGLVIQVKKGLTLQGAVEHGHDLRPEPRRHHRRC